jgi:hypothetical protein
MEPVIFGLTSQQLAAVVGLGLAFLFLREIACWYWKVNEAVKCLAEIRDELHTIRVNGIAPPK